jgi:hypothetical protein
MAQAQVDNMRSRLLNPSTPDPRGKATATPTANQLNKSGGRIKRPPSAATVAQQANGTDIKFEDGTFYAETLLDDSKGFVANKVKTQHTYHAVKKFELGAEDAPTRADGSQLIQSKHTLVFATPEYLAAKSKDAEVKRWRNLATAIGKGLADSSNKGVTIDDVANWILGQRTDRRWLFKRYDGNGVVFCKADDKGAVEWDDVPETQQKTIHKHLAAAKKRQGVDGESQYSGLDINTKIAQIEQMLADKYSDEALAKFPSEEYRTHMVEFRDLKKGELKRLIAKRDNQVAKALAKGAAGKGTGK